MNTADLTISIGAFFAYYGKPIIGSIFGGAGLASVLLVFYKRKTKNNK